MKKVSIILLALLISCCIAGCGKKQTSGNTNVSINQGVEDSNLAPKITLEEAAHDIQDALGANYDFFSVSAIDDTMTLNAANNGISNAVTDLKNGNLDISYWETATETEIELVGGVRNYLDVCGYTDIHVCFNVVSDENHEEVFLTIYDSEVIFDIVKP